MCPAVGIGRLGLAQKTERGELAKLLFCSCSDSRRSETPRRQHEGTGAAADTDADCPVWPPARRRQLWRMPCQGLLTELSQGIFSPTVWLPAVRQSVGAGTDTRGPGPDLHMELHCGCGQD